MWKNAFKIPPPPPLSEEDKKFLTEVSAKIKRKSMGEVAAFVVQSTKPVHNIGAQSLVFLKPLLSIVVSPSKSQRLVRILENPEAMEFFAERLNGDNHDEE